MNLWVLFTEKIKLAVTERIELEYRHNYKTKAGSGSSAPVMYLMQSYIERLLNKPSFEGIQIPNGTSTEGTKSVVT